MLSSIALLILLTILSTLTPKTIAITSKNQDKFWDYSKYKPHLAVFHIDYNKRCDEFLSNLKHIEKEFPKLRIFTIVCNEDNIIACDGLDLENLPHVEFYHHGTVKEHDGYISIDTVMIWLGYLHKDHHYTLEKIEHIEELRRIAKDEYAVLVYKGDMGGKDGVRIKRLAFKHKENVKTYVVSDESTIEAIGLGRHVDGLYIIRDAKKPIISVEFSTKDRFERDFIRYRFKPLININDMVWETIKQSDKHALIFFDNECHPTERAVLKHVHTTNKYDKIKFYKISPSKNPDLYETIRKELGPPNICDFIIAKKIGPYTWRKYLYAEHFTYKKILDVVKRLENDDLPLFYKSKPGSMTDKDELNCNSLSNAVSVLQKPLYVLFFDGKSNGYGMVKMFVNTMALLDKEAGFHMKVFDVDANDVREYSLEQVPVVMRFNPGDKERPIKYEGELSVEGLDNAGVNNEEL